ncbi:hypothetical protein M885DRAFT_569904 [Pelagophyceae sp. CCMP2097]|nr:hypothetical protein M885DRAFT_569904 [Pelagophyceae sp. CCMP2097]
MPLQPNASQTVQLVLDKVGDSIDRLTHFVCRRSARGNELINVAAEDICEIIVENRLAIIVTVLFVLPLLVNLFHALTWAACHVLPKLARGLCGATALAAAAVRVVTKAVAATLRALGRFGLGVLLKITEAFETVTLKVAYLLCAATDAMRGCLDGRGKERLYGAEDEAKTDDGDAADDAPAFGTPPPPLPPDVRHSRISPPTVRPDSPLQPYVPPYAHVESPSDGLRYESQSYAPPGGWDYRAAHPFAFGKGSRMAY